MPATVNTVGWGLAYDGEIGAGLRDVVDPARAVWAWQ